MLQSSIRTGKPIPENVPHAVSVSLPTWQDNIGYEEGLAEIIQQMKGGYPRFVIHPHVQDLFKFVINRFGYCENLVGSTTESLSCFIFQSHQACLDARKFLISNGNVQSRIVELFSYDEFSSDNLLSLHVLFFPIEAKALAKSFWQHTGLGISSRFALHALSVFGAAQSPKNTNDVESFVEERFGRVADPRESENAENMIKSRIADITNCEPANVYIFGSGMSAIYHAHKLTIAVNPGLKSVQFGFPYLDTLKIQQKFGSGCHFFGLGDASDLYQLKQLLKTSKISSLFCEFPSNPLLKSPPLKDLWDLSVEHEFLLIVDETIGNFWNISCLHHTDILVSSLTKVFSGDSNVMAGSMVLNPKSPKFQTIEKYMAENYLKSSGVWCQDLMFLERNSRNFIERVEIINQNAMALCDSLVGHPKLKDIFYPKYYPANYTTYMRQKSGNGWGGLFSLVFHDSNDAISFYDRLSVSKGPSLGTNFTLACPYTILAHYFELEWASKYGVDSHLVRISAGMENSQDLIKIFHDALQ